MSGRFHIVALLVGALIATPCATRGEALDFEGYLERGWAWGEKGEWEKALADYDRARALNPASPRPYHFRGMVWLGLREYEKAVAEYNKMIEIDEQSYIGFHNRGIALEALGDRTGARKDFRRAKEIMRARKKK